MLARLYRISALTAIMAVLLGAGVSQAAETQTANGYTIGGALQSFTHDGTTDNDSNWLSGQLDRLHIVASPATPTSGGPFAGYYSPNHYLPRDSHTPLDLGDTGISGFTPRDGGMLGLVYAAQKWQLGATYANSPGFNGADPQAERIDRYMLGTRYDAFGAVGFGAAIELRDYNTPTSDSGPDEQVFTFGTYVNF